MTAAGTGALIHIAVAYIALWVTGALIAAKLYAGVAEIDTSPHTRPGWLPEYDVLARLTRWGFGVLTVWALGVPVVYRSVAGTVTTEITVLSVIMAVVAASAATHRPRIIWHDTSDAVARLWLRYAPAEHLQRCEATEEDMDDPGIDRNLPHSGGSAADDKM